jgi:hypothetical protein
MTRSYVDHHGRTSGIHLDGVVVEALAKLLDRCGGDMSFFEKASGWEQMLSGGII